MNRARLVDPGVDRFVRDAAADAERQRLRAEVDAILGAGQWHQHVVRSGRARPLALAVYQGGGETTPDRALLGVIEGRSG